MKYCFEVHLERLEIKTINGKKYYYHSNWGRKDGKPRRLWQKYIGTLDDLLAKCGEPQGGCADFFDWGLSTALIKECMGAGIIEKIDDVAGKWRHSARKARTQGLTAGTYIAIAAINRASAAPCSKRSMWQWFSKTAMLRHFPAVKEDMLSSQNFWNHMEQISPRKCRRIWKAIIHEVLDKENVDISSVSYDGTNFYTFIDTFNTRCSLAKRGKNKQGRSNLRQVSYVLFCSADGHIPLHYEIYDGNRNDVQNFPNALEGFKKLFEEKITAELLQKMTLVFDKGNNAPDNFEMIDTMQLHFVGSAKLGEHKELTAIPNDSSLFKSCTEEFDGVKVHRLKKVVYGKERTVLVTWNPGLYTAQSMTVEQDIKKTIDDLSQIKTRLQTRSASELPIKGKKPTEQSVRLQCEACMHRPYMREVVLVDISADSKGNPLIDYTIDVNALALIANTYLGKNILITSRDEWDNEKIIRAYRSQYLIEDVFKEMKDRKTGEWWPMYHWTDTKIHVHALYCTIAVLLRAIIMRRVRLAGHTWSLKRVFDALNEIKEVVNVYKPIGRSRKNRVHKVLTRATEIHDELMAALDISTATFDGV
jgi:transposase